MLGIGDVGEIKGYRTLMTPSAVKFGPTDTANNYNPSKVGTTVSVGLLEGPVEINQNVETTPMTSDQMFNPYDVKITGMAWQVTFSLDQVDLYNFALMISFAQASVHGESVVALRGRDYFAGLKSMEIVTDGPRDTATGDLVTQTYQFFKVKCVSNGAITLGRATQSRLPVMVHCLANDSDIVGQVLVDTAYTSGPAYEG